MQHNSINHNSIQDTLSYYLIISFLNNGSISNNEWAIKFLEIEFKENFEFLI